MTDFFFRFYAGRRSGAALENLTLGRSSGKHWKLDEQTLRSDF